LGDWLTIEKLIGKDMKENGHDLLRGSVVIFAWRHQGKPQKC